MYPNQIFLVQGVHGSFPTITVPGFPGIPGIPGIAGIPGIPGIPGIAGIPGTPDIPGLPPIPGIPAGSGFVGFSEGESGFSETSRIAQEMIDNVAGQVNSLGLGLKFQDVNF